MSEDPFAGVVWRDAFDLGLRGIGWRDEARSKPFDRFPASMEQLISQDLWNLSNSSAGLYVDFRGPLRKIFVRWTLQEPRSGGPAPYGPYSAPSGNSGVDAYGLGGDAVWSWVGAQEAWEDPLCNGRVTREDLDGVDRIYRVYLPLMRRVLKFEVGAREPIELVAADERRPVAYYGTSIVHGAGVNRAGIAHAAQLGRALGREVLNLGFCGRAWCEPSVAEALGRLDPELYILDVLPNNGPEQLHERLPEFLRILRSFRPDTPVLLLGDRVFGDAAFMPSRNELFGRKNAALETIIREARAAGLDPLHLKFDPSWYGDDFEGTTDGSHPNDLGAWRMAQKLVPVVEKLLEAS